MNILLLKRGSKALKSIEFRDIVSNGGFEARVLVEATRRRLFYLPRKIGENHVLFLLDSRATNSFISPWLVERFGLKEQQTNGLKIGFVQ
jgi:hypothetical protein